MKSIDLRWRPGTARFEARGRSGAWISFAAPDEPEDVSLDDGPHGGEAGPSPAELLLAAGAGCAAWDVVGILRKQREDLAGVDCHVVGEQQVDAPWTFRRVELAFTVRGRGLDPLRVERAVALAVEKYCSVLSTIAAAATVEHTTSVIEEGAAAGEAAAAEAEAAAEEVAPAGEAAAAE
jgi:putative redox protein